MGLKLLGLALLTVVPVRARGNNCGCSEGPDWRADRRRPDEGYLLGNQYGFALGCPIQRPEAFNNKNRLLMSNFETLRNCSTTLLQSANVQTLAMRSTNESDHSRIIDDPNTRVFTIDASSDTATPFPYNGISASRLDPYALKLFQYYLLPTYNLSNATIQNRINQNTVLTNSSVFIQRIDWIESRNSTWFGRFASNNDNLLHLARPTIVNEFMFGFGKFDSDAYKENIPADVGVPGAPGVGGIPPLAPSCRGILGVSLTNELSGFGSNSNGPFLNRNVAIQWLDNLSVIRGDRSSKFVGEIRGHRYNQLGVRLIHKNGRTHL